MVGYLFITPRTQLSLLPVPLVCTNGGKTLAVEGVPLHSMDGARVQADLLPVLSRLGVPDPHSTLAGRRSYPIAVETPDYAVNSTGLPR